MIPIPNSPTGKINYREWENSLGMKCRLCGGKNCKRCSRQAALLKTDSPIKGLHADWVTNNLLAMMRPSNDLIKEFDILSQFKEKKIVAIFNLTLPGEHPYCGDGLTRSGFPYDPEEFMNQGIHFYNFGWKDMTVPELSYVLNCVKVMTSHLNNDSKAKIAIHCHAGFGRTGVAIACLLIYIHHIQPSKAIEIVRKGRPGSIETDKQIEFVSQFYNYINESSTIYAMVKIHHSFTLQEFLQVQTIRHHGERAIKYQYLPELIDVLCHSIEKMIKNDPIRTAFSFISHPSMHALNLLENIDMSIFKDLSLFPHDFQSYKVSLNQGDWGVLNVNECIHAPLLLDWFEHLSQPLLKMNYFEDCYVFNKQGQEKFYQLNLQSKIILRTLQRIFTCINTFKDDKILNVVIGRLLVAFLHLKNIQETKTITKWIEVLKHQIHEWKQLDDFSKLIPLVVDRPQETSSNDFSNHERLCTIKLPSIK